MSAATLARKETMALLALLAGAMAIGSAGIFVRLAETGPTASAFWRGAFALPFLAAWAWIEMRRPGRRAHAPGRASEVWAPVRPALWDRRFLWAGFFFAGDLALWHASLLLTSVAASTLEANLAPLFVTLFAWLLWGLRPSPRFLAALALALLGLLLMVSPKMGEGGQALLGDVLGVAAGCFYGAYIIAISRLRSIHGTGILMFQTTLVFSLLLLPLALTEQFLPRTLEGWMLLIALGVIAQFLGQGLIAYALAHLAPTFGSVGLYMQPVSAGLYAWLLLGEVLTPVQLVGAAVVLAAIALARAATSRA